MRHNPAGPTLLRGALAALLLVGCGGEGGGSDLEDLGESLEIDTTNQTAIDGLSRDQLEARVEPMSPERAEALGIVDTSIHLQSPDLIDTVIPLGGGVQPSPPDSLLRP